MKNVIVDAKEYVIKYYDILLEIPTRFGSFRKFYRKVVSSYYDNDVDKETNLMNLIDRVRFHMYEKNVITIILVTHFNTDQGFEDHSLSIDIPLNGDLLTEFRNIIGTELAEKYELRLTEASFSDPTFDSIFFLSIEDIIDREDIKLLLERLQ